MTIPMADDAGSWQQVVTGVVAVVIPMVGTGWGVVKWLLGKIDAVSTSNNQAISVLRLEVVSRLDQHVSEYRDDRKDDAKWRENILSMMATRNEVERQLDRQTEQIIGRLDAKFSPMSVRRRSHTEE